MAHDIYINEQGIASAAFATGAHGLPWHYLGQMVKGAMTWPQATELAYMNYLMSKEPLYMRNPLWSKEAEAEAKRLGLPVPAKGFKVPNQFGIVRNDLMGKPESVVGIVGNSYEITQIPEIGMWIDTIIENIDGAHYEAAGILGKGEKVWAVARIPFNINLGADEHHLFLLFISANDGSMSNKMVLTDVRPVCNNTITMALSTASKDACISVRHTKSAKERLTKIANDLQTGIKQDVAGLRLKFEKLITRKVTKQSFADTMTKLFGEKWEESKQKSSQALEIAKLFKDNDKNAYPEQADSGYALVNAVTNYVDHARPSRVTSTSGYSTTQQARAHSAWVGSGAALKQSALDTVLEVVEMPESSTNPNPMIQTKEKNESLDNIMDLIG